MKPVKPTFTGIPFIQLSQITATCVFNLMIHVVIFHLILMCNLPDDKYGDVLFNCYGMKNKTMTFLISTRHECLSVSCNFKISSHQCLRRDLLIPKNPITVIFTNNIRGNRNWKNDRSCFKSSPHVSRGKFGCAQLPLFNIYVAAFETIFLVRVCSKRITGCHSPKWSDQ